MILQEACVTSFIFLTEVINFMNPIDWYKPRGTKCKRTAFLDIALTAQGSIIVDIIKSEWEIAERDRRNFQLLDARCSAARITLQTQEMKKTTNLLTILHTVKRCGD